MNAGRRTEEWSCDQCGMDYRASGPTQLAAEPGDFVPRWGVATSGLGDDLLRRRPDATTWSAIEYGAHIGDVLEWMVDALRRMLREPEPTIAFFDPDDRADEEGYAQRPLDEVTARIERGADDLGAVLAGIDTDEGWSREATFGWGTRDVLDMARNAVHEGVHHLWDVERVLDEVR